MNGLILDNVEITKWLGIQFSPVCLDFDLLYVYSINAMARGPFDMRESSSLDVQVVPCGLAPRRVPRKKVASALFPR